LSASEAFLNLKSADQASNALSRARAHASFGSPPDQRRLLVLEKSVSVRPT
jgi:hypothetical protein